MRSFEEIVLDCQKKIDKQENIDKVFAELLNNAKTKKNEKRCN